MSPMAPRVTRRTALATPLLAATTLTVSPLPASAINPAPRVAVLNESLVFPTAPILRLTADTSYSLTNYKGARIAQGESKRRVIEIKNLQDGYYQLHLPDGAVPFIVATRPLEHNPFWGACGNFTNSGLKTTHRPEKLIPDLAALGVSSLRETYIWEQVEPRNKLGSYTQQPDYTLRDRVLAQHGLETFYVASSTHSSYGPWRNFDAPSTRDAYARHINQVLAANRQLKAVEICNEFNGSFNNGDRSGKNYASLLAHVYPIIKKAHPHVEVVAGGTAGEAFTFARDFFKAGGGRFMDTWSSHPYSVSGRGIYDAAEVYREAMRASGVAEKPCRVTELGWSITVPENKEGNNAKVYTEWDQATNLINAYAGAFTHPEIRSAHWYNALTTREANIRSGLDVEATEGSFGLFTLPTPLAPNAYSPRLAAYAFYTLRCALEGVSAGEVIRADTQYRYPMFGTKLSNGKYLLATSGWISGAPDDTIFSKQLPVRTLSPGFTGTANWQAQPILGEPAQGTGVRVPSNRMPAIITLS